MRKLKKALSFALAMMMSLAMVAPAFAAEGEEEAPAALTQADVVGTFEESDVQEEKPQKTNLVITKLVAETLNEGLPVDHNGGKLNEETIQKLGTGVKGLAGVTFSYYKIDNEDVFNEIKDNPNNFKTVEAVNAKLGQDAKPTGTITTNGNGLANVELEEGFYWFVESDRPSSVTGSVAVPFAISLPLLNVVAVGDHAPGSVYLKNVYIYPKNTSEKPEMDKYFGNKNENTDSSNLIDNHILHPDYQKYLDKKEVINARIGSEVPFEVKTSLKQGQVYKTLSWSDIMTDGLKFNQDSFKMSLNGKDFTDFKLTSNGDLGFDVVIENPNEVNELLQEGDVEITLSYTATVTKEAVVDMPESNNITFTPGEPKHTNSQTPVKPNKDDNSISTQKTWADGKTPDGVLVTYILIDKTTNTNVATATLKGAGNIVSQSANEGIQISATDYNVKFEGLNPDHDYVVEEFANGYDPEYISATEIKNIPNPDTITPTPPQVQPGGKKFVKTNQGSERLAGAEFLVKNAQGKYLVAKTNDQITAAQEAVTKAKEDLDLAIDTYNKLEKAAQTDEEKAKVDNAQKAYEKAFKDAYTAYVWGEKDDAKTFVSDARGRFEVTGLAYGTYKLEEIKAPLEYAKLNSDVSFTINANSYKAEGQINYNPENGQARDAQKVENKKITIPQTGGIGTVVFVVAGIILMGTALFAMKKRAQEN